MLWFGFLAAMLVWGFVIEYQRFGHVNAGYFDGFWQGALIGVPPAMAVVGPLTAGVGLSMQGSIQARRRKRVSA
jgi:hypothetical protein